LEKGVNGKFKGLYRKRLASVCRCGLTKSWGCSRKKINVGPLQNEAQEKSVNWKHEDTVETNSRGMAIRAKRGRGGGKTKRPQAIEVIGGKALGRVAKHLGRGGEKKRWSSDWHTPVNMGGKGIASGRFWA